MDAHRSTKRRGSHTSRKSSLCLLSGFEPYAPAAVYRKNIPGIHFCYWLGRHQEHIELKRFDQLQNPVNLLGINRLHSALQNSASTEQNIAFLI
jgi:hypothetical protein